MATNKIAVITTTLFLWSGLIAQAQAGNQQYDCKVYRPNIICAESIDSKTTYGKIVGKFQNFEWFKEVNNLPANVTPDMIAPAHTRFIVFIRK